MHQSSRLRMGRTRRLLLAHAVVRAVLLLCALAVTVSASTTAHTWSRSPQLDQDTRGLRLSSATARARSSTKPLEIATVAAGTAQNSGDAAVDYKNGHCPGGSKQQTEPVRFIVLFAGSSGSSAFLSEIGKHSQVWVPDFEPWEGLSSKEAKAWSEEKFTEAGRHGCLAVGFKVRVELLRNNRRAMKQWFRRQGIVVSVQYRHSNLDRAIASYSNSHLGQMNQFQQAKIRAGKLPPPDQATGAGTVTPHGDSNTKGRGRIKKQTSGSAWSPWGLAAGASRRLASWGHTQDQGRQDREGKPTAATETTTTTTTVASHSLINPPFTVTDWKALDKAVVSRADSTNKLLRTASEFGAVMGFTYEEYIYHHQQTMTRFFKLIGVDPEEHKPRFEAVAPHAACHRVTNYQAICQRYWCDKRVGPRELVNPAAGCTCSPIPQC